jgi:hypothetical protein
MTFQATSGDESVPLCRLGPSLADCATGRGNVRGSHATLFRHATAEVVTAVLHSGDQDEVNGKT